MSTLEAYFNGEKELFNGLAMERLEKEWNVYPVLHMDFSISKFSQMSIFSELNNLQNISLRDEYSAICGITEKELRSELKTDIEIITQANEETYEEACAHLILQYDGYHLVKDVRIFTIRLVCSMLLPTKIMKTSGSLQVHPPF